MNNSNCHNTTLNNLGGDVICLNLEDNMIVVVICVEGKIVCGGGTIQVECVEGKGGGGTIEGKNTMQEGKIGLEGVEGKAKGTVHGGVDICNLSCNNLNVHLNNCHNNSLGNYSISNSHLSLEHILRNCGHNYFPLNYSAISMGNPNSDNLSNCNSHSNSMGL